MTQLHVNGTDVTWPAQAADARAVYALAVDPECVLPDEPLADEIRSRLRERADEPEDAPSLVEWRERAAQWSTAESLRYLALLRRTRGEGMQQVLVRRTALSCAPLALMSGAWLQWLSCPGRSEDDLTMRILSLYASDIGAGHPCASRGSAYLTVLRKLLLSEYAAPVGRLPADERIADDAFELPALLLLMSRKPSSFTPEIMGADLCLRTVGLLPPLAVVREVLGAVADWDVLDPGAPRESGGYTSVEQCLDAVEALLGSSSREVRRRVGLGFAWALEELQGWSAQLSAELEKACDPAFEMAELLSRRCREASVYHHDFYLEDRSLSDWFRQAGDDPEPLLRALADSPLVRPGSSADSPLVNGLVAEDGPMFRVFSPGDLQVIRRWIDSLPAGEDTTVAVPQPEPYRRSPLVLAGVFGEVEEGHPPENIREAYFLLQSRNDTRALRRFALDYATDWLERAHRGVRRGDVRLPERWTVDGLRPWLLAEHDQHAREFEEAEDHIPSREELINDTIQLSPMTLIDGAWLQGFTDYTLASSEVGFSLFATYWDELGNSELRLNHPVIYRELLAEMAVQPPPTASREFAYWPGFADTSFELPVFWLSVSRFPRTFMPELLGLNLAIELSGVGGTYRRTKKAQQAHGFSTRFTDIHSTIDNVSTGHSAWAVDAVDTYLASIPVSGGGESRASVWDRVRAGYASLTPDDLGL
ncbi:heme oxygenase-like protein [Halopolyspora algeriensis]|uniref:Heme oxygenase-like protein n=1 Tax=Halopolyspora algeriensis TaxID=1500506 RepID=A0A368V8X4_9ACTN|nr:iron-containing redox enzyme family protein [Halopolyspora algeriensis]RCW37657.1 heme oxygenase-like protein [Halopolyspora algeriensis]TQM53809.1 heme oxygenase-like protein [Halopolyspora algeriensis]